MRRVWVAAVFWASAAVAAEADWGNEFDAVIAEPGTTVTHGKDNGGDPMREIRLANGVAFVQTLHQGRMKVSSVDRSGHGAVACAYGVYLGVRQALALCGSPPDEVDFWDGELARIEDFMVENARPLGEPAKEAMRVSVADMKEQAVPQYLSRHGDKDAFCRSEEANYLLGVYRKRTREKWTEVVSDMLSIPRPAATNPCQ